MSEAPLKELRAVVAKVEQFAPEIVLDPSDPLSSAKAFLDSGFKHDGFETLRCQGEIFLCWNGHWSELEPAALRALLYNFCNDANRRCAAGRLVSFQPNARKINDLVDALKALSHIPLESHPPCWLTKNDLEPQKIVPCRNGLLYLPTQRTFDLTPAFFSPSPLDFDFEPEAEEPAQWCSFLGQLWPDDPASIGCLQEIFGYLLTPDTRQQKAFLIVGPKRSGKGTIARILGGLLGSRNVCSPVLSDLSQTFGLEALIGKRAAVISDARLSHRADQVSIAERLLSISGEDALTINRKYRSAWTGRLSTRFVVLTNELPRMADASGALASRFVVLILRESFYGREDIELSEKLLGELPGILNWAIDGWIRLQERGHFVQPAASEDAIRELEELGSPVGAFVSDRCRIGPGKTVPVDVLFAEWKLWCDDQGRDHPGTKQTFGRDLRAAIPGLRTIHPRTEDGRERQYDGLQLS